MSTFITAGPVPPDVTLDRLRRLLPDLGDDPPGADRAVDSVRHGGDDRVDADPELDRVHEEPPGADDPRSADSARDRRPSTRTGGRRH